MQKESLSIIIPVYNSGEIINTTVIKLEEALRGYISYEVILVNDGSKDNSYIVCKDLAKKFKNIKFINLSKNFGQHNAILAGLHFAAGDYIVFMDDDLQTPPEEIWKLIDKIKEGFDVVYANYTKKRHNFFRNIGTRINNLMAEKMLGKPKNLDTTSYFIIRKYIAKELLKYEGPYPYLAGLIFRSTDNVTKVEVMHNERIVGKSNYSFLKLFKLWLNGFTNFSIKPLRASFILGIFLSIIGFLYIIALVIRRFVDPNVFIGWTSIIVIILFFSGIQLILIGLAGEYIGRVFLSQNKQPQYIIKEEFNTKEDGKI